MGLFNIFSDPLSPSSNTVGIYSTLGLSKKMFIDNKSLAKKIDELYLRGVDIKFPNVAGMDKLYNNISAEIVAICYPEVCKKYWKYKGKTVSDIMSNQESLFGEIIGKYNEAKEIYKKRHKTLK